MIRINLALLALLVAGGCGGDVTAPSSSDLSPAGAATASRSGESSDDRRADSRKTVAIPYEKWIPAFPNMVGNANGVLGAFTGTILQRIIGSPDPMIIHLRAVYVITDPRRKGHSFTAVVEGDQNLHTRTAVLTGVVTEGWRRGAPVLVNFDVLSPCTVPTAPAGIATCFKGVIRVGRAPHDDSDRED